MITVDIKNKLVEVVGEQYVFTDEETLNDYGKDHSLFFVFSLFLISVF